MERYRPSYITTAQCDVCGDWYEELIDVEPEIICSRCEYPDHTLTICEKCLREALKLIEEGECDK